MLNGTAAGQPASDDSTAGTRPRRSFALTQPRVWESSENLTSSATRDLAEALRSWPLWGRLAWQDVALRYRRSILGPFWLTLSMGVMIGALGIVYSQLFDMALDVYLPFIALGLLVWSLISTAVSEGCQAYIQGESLLRQAALPTMMFPLRAVWRNLITFGHNFVVYLIILAVFDVNPGWASLLAIPGLILNLLTAVWVAVLLGMISARFRDIPQIVNSGIQVLFFVTPIIWMPELMKGRTMIVDLNPFYHFIEVIRGPLMGKVPGLLSWAVVIGMTILGWVAAFVVHRRFHVRIAYWV